MTKRNVSNDNTKKTIAFEYQKLIALEYYFNASQNEQIYLECLGDVANNNESIEVKHHISKTNLNDSNIDFWNTLYNWTKDRDVYNQFQRLILHTTAFIPETSIFYNWEKMAATERYDKLKNVELVSNRKKDSDEKPEKKIKRLYDFIFNRPENEIKDILQKVIFKSSQLAVVEKWEELKQHVMMRIIDENHRDTILEALIGRVTHFAIQNSNKWHINKNDFDRDFRIYASSYIQKDFPFPTVDSKIPIDCKDSSFLFIEEIRLIGYNSRIQVASAVNDYLRASIAVDKMFCYSPLIKDNIENHDEEIETTLRVRKDDKCFGLKKEQLKTAYTKKIAQELYYNCTQEIPLVNIKNVQPIEPYYQRGRIHAIVEDRDFKWRFTTEDLHETD